MDPNLLRNLGYFSVPNNQTLNPVDQPGSASGLGSSQPQSPSIWDDSALTAAGLGRSKDGSLSGPSSISLDSLAGSTPGSSFNLFSPSMSSSSLFSQNPRSIISSRNPRRDGHEKKRSRLSSESTPFDSVDYWIQFDEEQQLQQQQKQFEQQQQRFQLQQRQLQQQQQQAQQRQRQQQKQQQQAQQQQGQQQTPDGEEKESGEKEEDEDERQEQQQQQQQPPPPPPPPQQQSQQQSQPQPQPQDVLDEADLGSMGTATQAKVPTPQRSTTMTTSQTSSGHKRREDSFDDSALEKALSDDGFSYSSLNLADQLSKIDTMPPPEIPPREGLYSTPLSWERPQMGLRLDSLMGLQTPSLSEDEQRRLIAIAMNTGGAMSGLGPSMNPNFGFQGGFLGAGLGQSPMGQFNASSLMNPMMMGSSGTPSSTLPSPSIKPSKMDKGKQKEMERERDKPKSADRTAHNDIERKYRTNLKDRIAELRDAVPALRTIPESALDDADDSTQPGRGPKVSKGTVLTKATDYIHYLEKKNKAIMQQHQELSRRLQAFEQLLSAAAQPSFQMPYSRTLFDPRAFC